MSTLAALRPAQRELAPDIEVAAAWRVRSGALMLLGRAPGRMPRSGTLQGPSDKRGMFRTLCWAADAGDGHVFLAAIRLPDETSPLGGSVLLLRGAADGGAVRLRLPAADTSEAIFGLSVAQLAGRNAAPIARFILDMLQSGTEADRPTFGPVLRTFLQHAAQPDGAIEIVGVVPGECVLLQGWGTRVTGPVQVVLTGQSSTILAGQAGEFGRADTPPPSCGIVIALPLADGELELTELDTVFLLTDTGLFARQVVGKEPLGTQDCLGHLRHMMPSLRCPSSMQALLRGLLRPRFTGVDTLAANSHPVRAAVDTAATGAAGTYLSGWVFDPLSAAAALHLCTADAQEIRLDDRWTRVPRPDVSDAFRNDGAFPRPGSDDAGFAVSVPITLGPGSYLRFTFTEGATAFVPVATTDLTSAAVRARLVAGVDLYKPSGLTILKRHVAPLLARLRPAVPQSARVICRGPVERDHAVVLPLPVLAQPRAVLSGLLHDPLADDEQLVLVCGPDWNEPDIVALCNLLRLYGLPATVLQSTDPAGPTDILREAARCTAASTFLLADVLACGTGPGWRAALRQAAAAMPDAAFWSPTLLYEDWSIRFAGSDTALVGMPGALATGETAAPSPVGALQCCLVRRSSLSSLDGIGAPCTDAGWEALFFLRLQQAGVSGMWVPSVQVYAPESAGHESVRAGQLVDGWLLEMLRGPAGDGASNCAS